MNNKPTSDSQEDLGNSESSSGSVRPLVRRGLTFRKAAVLWNPQGPAVLCEWPCGGSYRYLLHSGGAAWNCWQTMTINPQLHDWMEAAIEAIRIQVGEMLDSGLSEILANEIKQQLTELAREEHRSIYGALG